MPLTRIDLPAGRPPEHAKAVADAVQHALHDALGVPMEERFQVVAEHGPGGLVIDPSYLGVARSGEAVIVQVFLNRGRDAAKKKRFFSALADALHERAGLRREDWSFGNGEAQLA